MAYTITSAGKTFTQAVTIACPSGTYTLNDSIICNGAFTSNNGVINSNGFNITSASFVSNSGFTRSNLINGSTITPRASSGNFVSFSASGLTLSADTTFFDIPTSSSTRTFNGGGLTFGTINYTVAGSTGELDITGSNSFSQINFSDASNARSLKFTAGTTQTIRNGNGFNVRGTAGKLMTIDTITGASTFTLTSSNVQSTDYLNVNRSVVDASPKWYAGANSTDNDTDTNWIYAAGYALATGTSALSLFSLEYSAYANVNGVGSLTLAEQKLKYFAYKLGYTPESVRDGEISFLRLVTSSTGTDLRAMWNRYAIGLGQPSLNTEEEIKKNVFLNIGLPY